MANGFIVAKLHSHILYTSIKIKSVGLTSRRKYRTNSSSPNTIRILNKIIGKRLQNTLGVEVILKYVQDYPHFTTKPFFTQCTGRRHQKLGSNAPGPVFPFYNPATDRNEATYPSSFAMEEYKIKPADIDIGSKMQSIEYNKVKTKFQKAYFATSSRYRHQKSDLNSSDSVDSNPLKDSQIKDPATDRIKATYFAEKDQLAMENSEIKLPYIEIGSKVQTVEYINKIKKAKFQKPYFTKCSGYHRQKPGSGVADLGFPMYFIPSKNPASDLIKEIYVPNKNKRTFEKSEDKPTYVQTTEYYKDKETFLKAYFTKCSRRNLQKPVSNASEPVPIPLKDPAADPIEGTYFSEKDYIAIEKYENKPAGTEIGSKVQIKEYNKVKAKYQSPYFTNRKGNHKLGSNVSEPLFSLYPIPSTNSTPIHSRIKAIQSSDHTHLTLEPKIQRIEYNKVKAKYVENPDLRHGPDYDLKPIERIHITPKLPQVEEVERSDIESQLKYNKVKPKNPKYDKQDSDSKHQLGSDD